MRVYITGQTPQGVRTAIRKMAASPLLPPDATASIKFVSRRTITRANLRFRGINAATDVLSFPYETGKATSEMSDLDGYLGDTMVCTEVVHTDSRELGVPFRHHLLRVVAHGLLHLLGYDHKTRTDESRMQNLESRLVQEALKE